MSNSVANYHSRRRAETSKLWNTEWNLENRRQKKRDAAEELERKHDTMFHRTLRHPNANFLSQTSSQAIPALERRGTRLLRQRQAHAQAVLKELNRFTN